MATAVDAGAGIIDPSKPARYPIILSDALLGKPATEIFTGLRCECGLASDVVLIIPPASG
jgi:hypothetical protein